MRMRIYANLVTSPVSFPDQFEILIYPWNGIGTNTRWVRRTRKNCTPDTE